MAAEPIGRIKCTLCKDEVAVTEQKNGFAMYSCPWCGAQHFARSKHSDGIMRSTMIAGSAPVVTPNQTKAKVDEPVIEPKAEPTPAPKTQANPNPKPEPARKRSVLGIEI